MAFPVVPVALGAVAIGGIAWWLGGFSGGAAPTAAALGTTDGCARGTADAKAGKTPAQASADIEKGSAGQTIAAAATKSGNFDAYAKAFAEAHRACFDKNTTLPTTTTDADVKPIVPSPPEPPKKPPSTLAEWFLDRVTSQNDWFTWSRKGAQEGYNEYLTDYEYRNFGTKTAKSAARSCGYAQGWADAKVAKKSFGSLGKIPTTIPLNVENSIFASCSTKFDAWYEAHKHDQYAGKGGLVSVKGALVGWMKKAGETEVAGRVLVGNRVIFRLQKGAAVGRGITHHSPAMADNRQVVSDPMIYQNWVNVGRGDVARARAAGGRYRRTIIDPTTFSLEGYAAGVRAAGGALREPVVTPGVYTPRSVGPIEGALPPAMMEAHFAKTFEVTVSTVRTAGLADEPQVGASGYKYPTSNQDTRGDYTRGYGLGANAVRQARTRASGQYVETILGLKALHDGFQEGVRASGGGIANPIPMGSGEVTLMPYDARFEANAHGRGLGGALEPLHLKPMGAVMYPAPWTQKYIVQAHAGAKPYVAVATRGLAPTAQRPTNHPLGWPAPPY